MSAEAAQIDFYQAFMFTFGVTTTIASIGWWRARRRLRELVRERGALGAGANAELRHVLDDLAVEVERIGEGQRYLTRVLTDPAEKVRVPDK